MFATPSMARKNQIAKGNALKTPHHPDGKGSRVKLTQLKCGSVSPAKSSNSTTARIVIKTPKSADSLTPQILSAVKRIYAKIANMRECTLGKKSVRYAPIAAAIAGGAKTNSIFCASPARNPA
ncbi:MAG: hypothetical protein LDLANPLL_01755 [Turneriella sp.]|nr:hypothetical protein [Turneriella sp.]